MRLRTNRDSVNLKMSVTGEFTRRETQQSKSTQSRPELACLPTAYHESSQRYTAAKRARLPPLDHVSTSKASSSFIPTKEEQMLRTMSFNFLRFQNHKARAELNKKLAVSQSCAKFQTKNIDKVAESWKPLMREPLPVIDDRVPLVNMIKEKIRINNKNELISLTDAKAGLPKISTFYPNDGLQVKKIQQIETITKYLFKPNDRLTFDSKPAEKEEDPDDEEPYANQTLNLDTTAVNIKPFGFMHSRVNLEEPVSQINKDSIMLANHLTIMEKDYRNFTRKLNQNLLTYRVPNGVVPDPKHLNEFYRVEKVDRIDLRPFEELEKEYRPPLESIDKYYLGDEDEGQENLNNSMEPLAEKSKPVEFSENNGMTSSEVIQRPKKKRVVPAWARKHPRFSVKVRHSISFKDNNSINFRRSFMTDKDSLMQEEPSMLDQKGSHQSPEVDNNIVELPSEGEHGENSTNRGGGILETSESPIMSKTRSHKPKIPGNFNTNNSETKKSPKKPRISFATLAKTAIAFSSKQKPKDSKFNCVPRSLVVNTYRPMSR